MSTLGIIEDAAPAVGDGVNKDFFTSKIYNSGSLEVWLNGNLQRTQDDDGWVETGPDSFQLKEAPLVDERVRVYYEYET